MATLITGAGQVGTYVAKVLVERGERPVLFDVNPRVEAIAEVVNPDQIRLLRGSVLDMTDLLQVIRAERIDHIIHTAAVLPTPEAKPHVMIHVNIMGLVNVLEAARALGVRRVVYTSSIVLHYGAYPQNPPRAPITEEAPIAPIPGFFYGTTKIAAEYVALDYAAALGVDVIALRLGHVWGVWSGPFGAPISILLHLLVNGALRGEKVVIDHPQLVWGGREGFVHVRNAARALVLARDARDLPHRTFIITDARPYALSEFLDEIRKHFPQCEIEIAAPLTGGYAGTAVSLEQPYDISRARRELGYHPEFDLSRGIAEYVDWARRRYSMM
jgi:nucleoside-diphosphate-sugar epimerase